MKFLKLEIENFGSIGSLDVDLADQGLVLITGRNEDAAKADSNGAGKSLILEAFCWCLWGKTIRGLTGDDVVNNKEGKDCRVTVTLEEGDSEYQIIRTRKHTGYEKPNDLRIYRMVKPTRGYLDVSGATMAVTQQHIIDLIGMTFTLFCVMMPGAGKRAAEMTDREVKTLLERLLQTEVLGKAHDEVKARLKKVEKELSTKNTTRDMLMRAIEECNERLGDLKDKSLGFESKQQEIIAAIDKALEDLEPQYAEQRELVDKADKSYTTQVEVKDKLDTVMKQHDFVAQNLQSLKSTFDAQRQGRDVKRGSLFQKRKNVETELKSLPPSGGTCPSCHQEVPEEHIAAIRVELRAELRSVEKEESDLAERETQANKTYTKRYEELKAELQEHRNRAKILNDDMERFKSLQNQRSTALAVIWQLDSRAEELKKQRAQQQAAENPYEGLIEQTCQEAYDKAAEASRLYKDVLVLEHKQAVLDYWLTGFSPQGVRSFMLEHVTPLLNHSAQRYADLLTDGEMSVTFHTQKRQKSGKIVEKFNIQVGHAHGGESYAASSAGEKSRANLVVAFALGDLAALRANKTVSFRFLDEPFENVDESGTDAIVALLNDQKERFETVFVITHQDHFKQLFPNRLTVVKKNGFTALEGEHGEE